MQAMLRPLYAQTVEHVCEEQKCTLATKQAMTAVVDQLLKQQGS